jgi:7,8-dihydro-6-hydroxymethylpterin-pyrophosphokinase (HPPK)
LVKEAQNGLVYHRVYRRDIMGLLVLFRYWTLVLYFVVITMFASLLSTQILSPVELGPDPSHPVPGRMFRTLSNIISTVIVKSPSARAAPSLARSVSTANNTGERVLAIALGSNLGDKVRNIETALRILEAQHGIRVVDTSFLYESGPMYVRDQPRFVNGACLVSNSVGKLSMRF